MRKVSNGFCDERSGIGSYFHKKKTFDRFAQKYPQHKLIIFIDSLFKIVYAGSGQMGRCWLS